MVSRAGPSCAHDARPTISSGRTSAQPRAYPGNPDPYALQRPGEIDASACALTLAPLSTTFVVFRGRAIGVYRAEVATKFVVTKTGNNKFRSTIVASNGQVVATSNTSRKDAALDAITSLQRNVAGAQIDNRTSSTT